MRNIRFNNQTDYFYTTLVKRVNEYFITNQKPRYANSGMKIKIIFFFSAMGVFYAMLLNSGDNYLKICIMGFLFGIFSFLTALNIAHDAAHGAISNKKSINNVCLYVLNLIGINSYIWKLKHLLSHHTFPNVMGTDADIGESKIGRLIPNAQWKWFCKYQSFYIPILYLFYSAHWVLFKDFKNFKTLRVPNKDVLKHPPIEYLILIIGKLFALMITFVIPLVCLKLSLLQAICLFFIMHLGPGLFVALFLAPGHLNSAVTYPLPDKNGMLNTTWSEHQVITTVDFSTDNIFFNFFLGGFNHHVSHHLFPTVCHCHYPKITPIVKKTAAEFNIKYQSTNFTHLFSLHIAHLKSMGIREFEYDVL